ncbi:transposase [Salinimonas lutimaris]|uniref:transposase n=1 Tax=Salinimonas lutimaris TaxID=914153 RepID=UPI0010C0C07B|nr:transposase [Salinimonas lutimaris]
MPLPRKSLISLSETPYYHCVSRCVRRAYLCGRDALTGQSYEHRRGWVEQRLLLLGKVFAIDICAYAVMSNHTHVVLHVNNSQAMAWSTREVLLRWHRLHQGTVLTRRYVNDPNGLNVAEIKTVEEAALVYRHRLFDISWFMRLLNEYIARRANKEDECTGRFWEGRFKSQALLDETALAACMAYVDLNPVRAHIAKCPEHSTYTSIQKRIKALKSRKQPGCLYPLASGNNKAKQQNGVNSLPFTLPDYLQLVDYIYRSAQHHEGGTPHALPQCFNQSGLSNLQWSCLVSSIESQFSHKIGITIFRRKIRHTA